MQAYSGLCSGVQELFQWHFRSVNLGHLLPDFVHLILNGNIWTKNKISGDKFKFNVSTQKTTCFRFMIYMDNKIRPYCKFEQKFLEKNFPQKLLNSTFFCPFNINKCIRIKKLNPRIRQCDLHCIVRKHFFCEAQTVFFCITSINRKH